MLYSVPAQITTEQFKQGYKILLLVDFSELPGTNNYRRFSNGGKWIRETGTDGVVTGNNYFSSATAKFLQWNTKEDDELFIDGTWDTDIASLNSDTAAGLDDYAANGSGLDWILYHRVYDSLRKNMRLSVNVKMPELINGMSSIGSANVQLVDFRGTIALRLLSDPEIIGTEVNVWLQFDDGTAYDYDDAVNIYSGIISSYNQKQNTLTVKLKNKELDLGKLPATLLGDTYSFYAGPSGYTEQIQFGDFNWANDFQYWAEWNEHRLAAVIYSGRDVPADLDHFHVANHDMTEFPTGTNFKEMITATSNDYNPPWAFIRVENSWCPFRLGSTETFVMTNSESENSFTRDDAGALSYTIDPFIMHHLTAEWSTGTNIYNNDVAGFANCIDGDSTTTDAITGTENLSVQTIDRTNLGQLDHDGSRTIYWLVSFGAIDVTGAPRLRVYDVATSSLQVSLTLQGGMADTSQHVQVFSATDPDDYFVNVGGSSGGAYVVVKNITVWDTIPSDFDQDLLSNPVFYSRGQGRNYSSVWTGLSGSRKTSGNLIENPADAIESILRDDLGYTGIYNGNPDTTKDKIECEQSFDDTFDIFNAVSIAACGSIYQQQDAEVLLKQICKMFNFNLNFTMLRRWRLDFPQAAGLDFENSASGTPDADDIFTDDESVVGGFFSNHPILKGSFQYNRTKGNEKYDALTIRYGRDVGTFLSSVTVGSGKTLTLNNFLISDSTNATALRDLLDDWVLTSKALVSFKTWYNAIHYEIGDAINIQHAAMRDDMVDATVATQKWMILEKTIHWHPPHITVKAIELV